MKDEVEVLRYFYIPNWKVTKLCLISIAHWTLCDLRMRIILMSSYYTATASVLFLTLARYSYSSSCSSSILF